MNRRATALACALLMLGLAAGCTDDEKKPLSPDTGEDLETPTTKVTPPSAPPQ